MELSPVQASEWLDMSEAISFLGRGYSRTSIKRRVATGELVEGLHYVRLGPRITKFNVRQIQADWVS